MATENLQIPDIQANQNQKEVTANAAHNLLDRALNGNGTFQKTIAGSGSFTTTETRENFVLELTGTPGAPFTVNMPDTNRRTLIVVNNTDDVATIRNSAGAGTGQPVIPVGGSATFYYTGTNFINISATIPVSLPGKLDLNLGSLREIATNDIPVTASDAGVLSSDTTPSYARVNLATDKALRVEWVAGNVDEVQFPPTFMPPDLDETKDVTVHLLARMSGATDTPTIDVQVFNGIGDTEMGSPTAALSGTLAELTVTLAAADISGHPLGFLNISLIPGAHATDALELYAAWIEYTRKSVF